MSVRSCQCSLACLCGSQTKSSAPYKQSMTDADIDTVLGPATPARDCEIQGWTGKAGIAFKEGWEMGYREALERAAKVAGDCWLDHDNPTPGQVCTAIKSLNQETT